MSQDTVTKAEFAKQIEYLAAKNDALEKTLLSVLGTISITTNGISAQLLNLEKTIAAKKTSKKAAEANTPTADGAPAAAEKWFTNKLLWWKNRWSTDNQFREKWLKDSIKEKVLADESVTKKAAGTSARLVAEAGAAWKLYKGTPFEVEISQIHDTEKKDYEEKNKPAPLTADPGVKAAA